MHRSRVEQQRAVDPVRVRAMRVPEHDHVGVWKSAPQAPRQTLVRLEEPQAQRPQQRLRLLDPTRSLAVDDDDAQPFDDELAGLRQRGKRLVVIAAHRLHRRERGQLLERGRLRHIAGMDDDLHTAQRPEHPVGQRVDELRAVRVGNDPDPGLPSRHYRSLSPVQI